MSFDTCYSRFVFAFRTFYCRHCALTFHSRSLIEQVIRKEIIKKIFKLTKYKKQIKYGKIANKNKIKLKQKSKNSETGKNGFMYDLY